MEFYGYLLTIHEHNELEISYFFGQLIFGIFVNYIRFVWNVYFWIQKELNEKSMSGKQ